MKTALEIAMDRAAKLEPIPPMTDPLGRHWRQPARRDIEIDEDHALMTRATFDRLSSYNSSYPSGVYIGKMWRRFDGSADYDFLCRGLKPFWCLCWYGPSTQYPGYCYIEMRRILLSDGELPQ